MKKQILFLLIAILGFSSIGLAQSLKNDIDTDTDLPIGNMTALPSYCPPVSVITAPCITAPGPFNPTLGQLYTYTVAVTPPIANPSGYIHWFVTDDPIIIEDGAIVAGIEDVATSPYIITASGSYNSLTNVSPTVDITWEGMPATGPLFLVTYVKKTDGCTDNVKVYKIQPQHIFMLDMAYISPAGTQTAIAEDCVAPVWKASFDATVGTNGEMLYDYGTNHIFFVVNASNWAHSWKPNFQLTTTTGLTASAVLDVDWATPAGAFAGTWNGTTLTGGTYLADGFVTPSTGTAVGAAGECIIVRVLIDHNQNQTIADIPFSLAVDGIMYDQVNDNYANADLGDIHFAANPGGGDCPWIDGFANDILNYTLRLRPTVTDATPPAGDDFILGNEE